MGERLINDGVGGPSSLWLFEATGDSEVDAVCTGAGSGHECYAMEEDDAESCSDDLSDRSVVIGPGEFNGGGCGEVDGGESEGAEEYEECCWDGGSGDDDNEVQQVQYKSCVSVESTTDFMNEMERSKLFWEACLAS